VNKPTGLS